MVDLFQETTLSDSQLDYYTYSAIQDLNLVAPQYSPKMLAEVKNTYHEQAHLFKSRIIKGFHFVDEDNAKKIREFLKTSLYDQFGNQISFQKYIEMQLFNYSIHYRFFDEIGFFGGEVKKLYPTSPKYIYPDREKTTYWQIKPNSDLQEMLSQPGSEESQINYKDYHTEFLALTKEAPKEASNQLFEFAGKGSASDYFPNIPYLGALGSIRTNKYIGSYNQKWLENGTNWKSVVNLYGLDEDDPAMKRIIDDFERKLNDPTRNGRVIVKGIPNEESKVAFEAPQQNEKEDFSAERDANRDEILAANGLNPTVLSIKTNEGSLTSTDQIEAIQIYIEMAKNDIRLKQEHYDILFKIIDPNYDTNLIFEPISFEDAEVEAEAQTAEIDNETKLIALGSMERYNEYRTDRKRKVIEKKEWDIIRSGYLANGVQF